MKLSDEQIVKHMEEIGACKDREAQMCQYLNDRMQVDAAQVVRIIGRIGMRPAIVKQDDEKADR